MVAKLFITPFAKNGNKTTIPDAAQPGGEVSYDQGFGPDYERQLGVDPAAKNIEREDFNQAMSDITVSLQEMQSGLGASPFSSALAAALPGGGYPVGAQIPRTSGAGYWLNTVAANTSDPEAAGVVSWRPVGVIGTFTQAVSNIDVTLSNLNGSFSTIKLTGTLTANISIILPLWAGHEVNFVNSTTGDFAITVKGPTGTGAILPRAEPGASVTSDGTNYYLVAGGGGGATGGGSDKVFYENGTNVTVNYTITAGKNAMSAGPITVNDGITVTVPDGSTWSVV